MNVVKNYTEAVKVRIKSHEDTIQEMEEPLMANFAQKEYHFPNGIMCGVGKSRRPGHASMYQIIVVDFAGKPNIKFPIEFSGEYTTPTRAEKSLLMFCKAAWETAEGHKTKQIRKTEAAKELSKKEQMDVMLAHKETTVTKDIGEPESIEISKVADQSTRLLPQDKVVEDAPETSN
jgi:hypothetical protein